MVGYAWLEAFTFTANPWATLTHPTLTSPPAN
jgi:hypothetical protein